MADVTVLMPVHNGERYLRPAIDSIFAQTYGDFEFVIVDDGSTDSTAQICRSYADARLRVITLAPNRGLSEALNAGLAGVRTELVARLDADDLAEPQRLARQREMMRAEPRLALLGSQAVAVTPDGVERGTVRRSLEAASILWTSVFDNPFIHPTVMFRTRVIRDVLGGYRREFDPFSQDYDLWCRVLALEGFTTANLPDRLVRHRVHESSIMGRLSGGNTLQAYDQRFDQIARQLIVEQARRLFDRAMLPDEEARLLPGLILGLPIDNLDPFLAVFEKLLAEFQRRHPHASTPDFALTLARQYDTLTMRVTPSSRRAGARILLHGLRHHPEVTGHLSWPRALALLLLGKSGRERVGSWSRRYIGT
jgi:glycosyltransferase involved in cell wall biosynthesis